MNRVFSLIFLSAIFIAACGPKPPARTDGYPQPLSDDERRQIVETAERYLETPYRHRGQTPSGFDCSGFIYSIYLEAISLRLPRSTRDLYNCTRSVNIDDARPGDLIFFSIKDGLRPDHVGLYLDDLDFIHSSKSRGVTISNLSDQYYRRKFLSARRLRYELIVGDSDR
jgi:cell wall-associated NlpC family hydrolase